MEQQQIDSFINTSKGLLIAPAGHGKTHAIASLVKSVESEKPQLVLTHTHAGIAALRKKMKEQEVPSNKYVLDTICGFIQRYAEAFIPLSKLPKQDKNDYFSEIQDKALPIFQLNTVKTIVRLSYSHLYVDEYQDCTLEQHKIIMCLADVLPLHILGDPLQGIFNFGKNQIVEFNKDLDGIIQFDYLQTPWRWKIKYNCEALGDWILSKRQEIMSNNSVNLQTNEQACVTICKHEHLDDSNRFGWYRRFARNLHNIETSSTLIIVPSYKGEKRPFGNIYDRIIIKSSIDFSDKYLLLDALDSKDYYQCASKIDTIIDKCLKEKSLDRACKQIEELLKKLCLRNKDVRIWIENGKLKAKRKPNAEKSNYLRNLFQEFSNNPSHNTIIPVIKFFCENCKTNRIDLTKAIKLSLDKAAVNHSSVLQEMSEYKNILRHIGRKVEGKCLGTTLLTKGLEFDTVIILHADRIESSRDFYVAISRACKKLYIYTEKEKLEFTK